MKKCLMYLVSFVLVCGYLAVLLGSRDTSKVSFTYEKYFLTRELAYYVSDEALAEYTTDEEIVYANFGRVYNQGSGWGIPDATGCTMTDATGNFFLYVEDPSRTFTLWIRADRALDEEYSVFIGGVRAGEFCFGDYLVGGFLIPPNTFEKGENLISIRSVSQLQDSLHVYSIWCE